MQSMIKKQFACEINVRETTDVKHYRMTDSGYLITNVCCLTCLRYNYNNFWCYCRIHVPYFMYTDNEINSMLYTQPKSCSVVFRNAYTLSHTRETVNLYTTGAPWKEKLTVSGVGVVGSN